ncbi:hypothetical protein D1B33_04780 [Lysinibacillus yapensis]|uniref:Uncharacterized protein n=1 Tax=Ureibacillus yapensis TaxID=2304605 RepID=A0A396SGL0_9BACL|nr:hypothetical protein [Lysinibacillus yapensis]RHW38207.1 hypothetical protein D1B33_04780 [Lysinibacillus yapensis]
MEENLFHLNIDPPKTKEELQKVITILKGKSLYLNLNAQYNVPEGTITNYIESRNRLKNTLEEKFPDVDADKFIKFVITSPLKSPQLDFSKVFDMFMMMEHYPENNRGNSDIKASLTVNEPPTTIDKKNYLLIFMTFIFPVLELLLSQFQNYQDGQEIERLQNLIEHQIEEDMEYNENQEIIIEIENYNTGGIRT